MGKSRIKPERSRSGLLLVDTLSRYEQNEDFFVRMFKDPEMMGQIMQAVGGCCTNG